MTADDSHVHEVLTAQMQYYELRAPDYAAWTKPPDRAGRGLFPSELSEAIFDGLRPSGDVLELACGPGPSFTSELARYADSVTAVDASPTMLRLNQLRVASPKVTYVAADLFDWTPQRSYDFVFFGHWLSHIPASRFPDFWELVRRCTGEHGRVGFIDEDDRGAWMDSDRPSKHTEVARRTLADGRHFDIIKVFWSPDDLQGALRSMRWVTSNMSATTSWSVTADHNAPRCLRDRHAVIHSTCRRRGSRGCLLTTLGRCLVVTTRDTGGSTTRGTGTSRRA